MKDFPERKPKGCHWIEGDVRVEGWSWCNEPTEQPFLPWCKSHRERVYQPLAVRPLVKLADHFR